MSDQPKRYCFFDNGKLCDFVKLEDFENLLDHSTNVIQNILNNRGKPKEKIKAILLRSLFERYGTQEENPINKYVLPYDFDKDAENIADCLGYALRSVRERMSDQLINPTLGLDNKEEKN